MITFDTGVTSVQLPNPEYGDSRRHDTGLQYSVLSDDSIVGYHKVAVDVLLLQFNSIKTSYKDAFITFYLATIGEKVYYIDQNGDYWYVTILNNPLEAVTVSGSGACALHNITVQMSGVLIDRVILTNTDADTLINTNNDTLVGA